MNSSNVASLKEMIAELKAKQLEGTLSEAELEQLAELEAQLAEAMEQEDSGDGEAEAAADNADTEEADSSLDVGYALPLAGLGMLGLGSGGSSEGQVVSSTNSTPFSGSVINGYIQGANVFQDTNNNGIFDEGEPNDTTNKDGEFTLAGYVPNGGGIIAAPNATTIDATTGVGVTTVFRGGSDTEVLSPLTTLLETTDLTEAQVKTAFGLDSDIDLHNFDPIATALHDDTSAEDVKAALHYKAVTTSVSNLLDLGSETLATGNTTADQGVKAVTQAIETAIKDATDGKINLGDASTVHTIVVAAEQKAPLADDTLDFNAVASSVGTQLAAVNQSMISSASGDTTNPTAMLNDMYKSAKFAQSSLTESVKDVINADAAERADKLEAIGDIDVATEINNTVIGDGNLVVNGKFDTLDGWLGNAANKVVNGDESYNFANVATAGNPWDVGINYGLELTQGNSYEFSFRAKGAEGRDLTAGIGLNFSPWTSVSEDIKLTEDWQTFTMQFNNIAFGDANSRVIFDMGHDVGEVYIDDVVLTITTASDNNDNDNDNDSDSDNNDNVTDPSSDGAKYTFDEAIADSDHGHWNGVYRGIESQTETDGSTVSTLAVVKTVDAAWHAGVNLIDEYRKSDLIGDGSDPITMRVFAEQDGTLSLTLEATGYDPFNAPTVNVTAGWNDVSFDLSGIVTANGYHKAILRPDSSWPADGASATVETKYYIDEVNFPQASVVPWPVVPDADNTDFMAGATTPTESVDDVISLYSNEYDSALNGVDITEWSDGAMSEITIDSGNTVQKFEETVFAGFDVPGNVTVTGMNTISISLWRTDDGSTFEIKLVDLGAGQDGFFYISADQLPKDQWVTLEIPLSDFEEGGLGTGRPLAADHAIDQLILKPMGGKETFFVDDFFLTASTVPTPTAGPAVPTAGPAVPTAAAADVVSVFSDTYTEPAVPNMRTNWSGENSLAEDVDLGGNAVKKWSNLDFIGIEPGATIDASTMGTFNVTVWKMDADADLKVKLVDFATGGVWTDGGNVEHELILSSANGYDIPAGEWVNVSLNLSDFTGLTSKDNIGQIIIGSTKDGAASGETVYVDDIYFGPVASTGPTAPTAGPAAPTAAAADVVSVFSDTYTEPAVPNMRTNWSGENSLAEDVDLGGNAVKKWSNLDFIGIEPGATIDASTMGTFNVTVWKMDADADLKVKLVDFATGGVWTDGGNVEHELILSSANGYDIPAGEWVNVSLNLSDFTGLTSKDNIGQIIIGSTKDGAASGETVYVDDIYFGPVASTGPTAPTAGPAAPTAAAADVVSVFSDTYTEPAVPNMRTNWSGENSLAEDVDLGGNAVKKWSNLDFIGIEPGATIDASTMGTFNVTVWKMDADADLKVKLVDFATGGVWTDGGNVEHELILSSANGYDIPAGEWVNVSLNLSDFTGLTSKDNIGQIIIGSTKDGAASGETVYVDDIYFGPVASTGPTAPTAGPAAPTAAAADVVSVFSDTYTEPAVPNMRTNWSGENSLAEDVDLGGNAVKKWSNLDFIGIEPGATIDASTMGTFNVTVWKMDADADLKVKLVDFATGGVWTDGGNVEHELILSSANGYDIPAGEWVNVSLNLSDFTGLTSKDNIGQIIIGSTKDGAASGETVYVDDIYFAKGMPLGVPEGFALAFADEFNAIGEQADSANWTYDLGNDGWGNNEAQDYQNGSDDAIIVDVDPSEDGVNGALRITAKNVDGTITSARVKSDIDDLAPYGYYEIRAKLPSESGAWPAIWLLGQGGRDTWPSEGEIDIVEWSSLYADSGSEIIHALHFDERNGGNAIDTDANLDSDVDNWHIYQLWWTPESITLGVDGSSHLVYEKPEGSTDANWPYDDSLDLIMNIAIGGTLGGEVPSENFEYTMDIDYVKVYRPSDESSSGLTLTFETDESPSVTAFEGGIAEVVSSNQPAGSDGDVVKFTKAASGQPWAGVTFTQVDTGELINPNSTIVSMDVLSPKDGATVMLKLEDASDPTIHVLLNAVTETNGSEAWETLTWDFGGTLNSESPALDHANTYSMASVFFDFQVDGDDNVYYFDNVKFEGFIA